MTPRQAHAKAKKAIRLAKSLWSAVYDAQVAISACHGSHTTIAAQARRAEGAADMTLGLISDVFVQSGDILLKDVSK